MKICYIIYKGENMNIKIEKIKIEKKEVLRNLMEKYNYEFSQYDDTDVNCLGLYGYDHLDYFWLEKGRIPFFIKLDKKLAGFVLLSGHPEIKIEMDYKIAEFFVMYKYRRLGIGKTIIYNILNKYKGKWQIKYHTKNIAAVKFWNKIIKEYTNGNYKIIKNNQQTSYKDEALCEVIIFDNKNIETMK